MLKKETLRKDIKKLTVGTYNISKTVHRINHKGKLSTNPISRKIKTGTEHPYFTFEKKGKVTVRSGESASFQSAVRTFQAVHEVLISTLNDGEYLWTKDFLAEDKDSGIYLSFIFPSDLFLRLEKEEKSKQWSVQKIASIYHLFADEFYNRLGILDVKVEGAHLQVKFHLDYQEPESMNFEKMEAAFYTLLTFIFYEEETFDELVTHIHTSFEDWKLPGAMKKYVAELEQEASKKEEKESKEEIIEKLTEFIEEAKRKPYHLKGYEEMEISTQIFLFDAIRMGVRYEFLDEADHLLRLSANGRIEYVQQGTRTGLVDYISSIIMENKYVSKLLLEENNFSVPQASIYARAEDAVEDYEYFEGKEIVVKPKSTNKGIGISIFKPVQNKVDFEKAIERAFLEDNTILIEEFIAGTEYRFFVLNGKCRDVLLRIPANVKGDGKHTIEELVQDKNKDVNRGYGGRTPLEIIEMGEVEQLTLSQQGFDFSSIPAKEEIVYLRENSNISTGGDSVNFLEQMDDSYIKVAEAISQTLDANVCGVDLIIPDYQVPSTEENPGYHFLEGNANPGMYAHIYVAQGKGVRLTMHVLDALFPELNILSEEIEIDV